MHACLGHRGWSPRVYVTTSSDSGTSAKGLSSVRPDVLVCACFGSAALLRFSLEHMLNGENIPQKLTIWIAPSERPAQTA